MKLSDTAVDRIPEGLLDLKQLEEKVDAVLNAELYWFPVRHHSPAVARLLQQKINERRPKIIFIEGPSDCNHLISHIINKDTKPPIALYSSYRDDDNTLNLAGISSPAEDIPFRSASWYPMMEYSPEFAAMKTAAKIDAECCFIDLPHYARLKPFEEGGVNDEEEPDLSSREEDHQELLTQSAFYKALAETAGFKSWDEAWDSLFEFGQYNQDPETFRRELAVFCAASRLTASEDRMSDDGTYEREAYMRHMISKTLKEKGLKESDAMVVCGGFHLFMDLSKNDFPDPPEGTVYNSLVPYSFFRISELSGYAAGNRAPQFYQSYWEYSRQGKTEDLLPNHIVSILKKGRRKGENLSSADAISITQHATMLAQLRNRPTPVLEDIHDAVMSCCCKGDPNYDGQPLQEALDEADIGRALGKVCVEVGRLPIVSDFHYQLHNLGMNEFFDEEKQIVSVLDKQDEEDRKKSEFLHRLAFLKIPGFKCIRENNILGSTMFKEKWTMVWSPDVESKLIEENLYGDTVESAALARVQEAVAKESGNAAQSCKILLKSIKMSLPGMVQHIEKKCADAIASDQRLISLAGALNSLQQIEQYSSLHLFRQDSIRTLTVQAYDRACFAIPSAASVPEEDQDAAVQSLKILAEVLFKDTTGEMDAELFSMNIQTAASATGVPYLKGAFEGLLAELKVISSAEVLNLLSAYASAAPDILIQAGDFLEGLLSVSRTSIITGSPLLIEAIEQLLLSADEDSFMIMLPKLRHAFENLHRRSKSAVAKKVAERHGLAEAEELLTLNTSAEAAAVIARLDGEVDRIMKEWEF